jgi:hypothetical protein
MEKVKEILYPMTQIIGADLGLKIKELMPMAGESAESLGRLVQSLAQVLNQRYKPAIVIPDCFEVEVTDCACQTYTPEFCGQYGALVSGIINSLNLEFEFIYDRMMTKGDETCHWVIRKKGALPNDEKESVRASESSLELLKKRFARGEINEENYRRMKRVLEE